jgi:phosphoserine phosphatase RsbU/P
MSKAALLVIAPNGSRSKVVIEPVPFRVGRHEDCNLVLLDARTSRMHAQIIRDGANYFVEDTGSRHGVYVNGRRIKRHLLENSDMIEFGVPDSYQVRFSLEGFDFTGLTDDKEPTTSSSVLAGANLGRLKAVLEIGRTLQTSYSLDDVLNSVLDAALATTGAERGFLFLSDGSSLAMRCARDCRCKNLPEESLKVSRTVLAQALKSRSELLSMTFRPGTSDGDMTQSIADLQLRGVVCVPLVRISSAPKQSDVAASASETTGVLYLDSRSASHDMAAGNRELLQSLAIEASIILENARLLEEERGKKKLEEELDIARGIQQGLLPRNLPQRGWLAATGSSTPSHQVGGDYYDVAQMDDGRWAALVVDVSGKGVSSALVASLLQGAFLTFGEGPMDDKMRRINHLLTDRTEDGKYATIFYSLIEPSGIMRYINAGHCAPLLISRGEKVQYLETTGLPAGLIDEATFNVSEVRLNPGDRVVIYSDGVTDANNPAGEFFGRRRLRQTIEAYPDAYASELHQVLLQTLSKFTEGTPQSDDITLVVLQYQPDAV